MCEKLIITHEVKPIALSYDQVLVERMKDGYVVKYVDEDGKQETTVFEDTPLVDQKLVDLDNKDIAEEDRMGMEWKDGSTCDMLLFLCDVFGVFYNGYRNVNLRVGFEVKHDDV